jgi:apolipoprotein N-acyltransferase
MIGVPILITLAALAYGLAFATTSGAAAVLVALPCILLLSHASTPRRAFYAGLVAGIVMYAPHLLFFWSVFGPAAMALWLVAGLPIAVFVLLLNLTRRGFGTCWAFWLTPVLWTGVEYFRSECYYLKFAWLLPGQVVAFLPGLRLLKIGVYGVGFVMMCSAAMVVHRSWTIRAAGLSIAALLALAMYVPPFPPADGAGLVHVAGVQFEQPDERATAAALETLADAHPEAQILVLSEYTFAGPVPEVVREVVRKHGRYLIAGGTRPAAAGKYYDTAYVIGPDGQDLFHQDKSVPVQLMIDGLPATQRRIWNSPWGKIGIAVCYDISYARVMDDFVRQGAEVLIVPTMDLGAWGGYERRMLHGRLAPVRAAEYGIPVFGVWSSGESQLVDSGGRILAIAGYPGQGEMIAGPLHLAAPGQVPPDRWLALACTCATGLVVLSLMVPRSHSR